MRTRSTAVTRVPVSLLNWTEKRSSTGPPLRGASFSAWARAAWWRQGQAAGGGAMWREAGLGSSAGEEGEEPVVSVVLIEHTVSSPAPRTSPESRGR